MTRPSATEMPSHVPLAEPLATIRRHMLVTQKPIEAPHLDPVSAYNLMLKLVKRVAFSLIVDQTGQNRLCNCNLGLAEEEKLRLPSTSPLSYERTACVLDSQLLKWFKHAPACEPRRAAGVQMVGCAFSCTMPAAARLLENLHVACAQPHFPSSLLARVTECNHILQSHLVQGDACVAVMGVALRSAMQFSHDFAVVVALVVQDFTVRKATAHARSKLPLLGYAYEEIEVRFINFVVTTDPSSTRQWRPVAWSLTFPARKVLAAFWSQKRLWERLQHVPCFTAIEVGQKAAAAQWRNPQNHSLSPQLLLVWPVSGGPLRTPLAELVDTNDERGGGSTPLAGRST